MKHYGEGTYKAINKEGREYKLSVIVDDYADDPRNWDNVSQIWCWHRNYKIGDRPYGNMTESIDYLCEKYNVDGGIEGLQKSDDLVLILISAYEHGAITISTTSGYPYNDYWDGGVIGFAFIDKQTAMENWNTNDWKLRATDCINNEVAILDDWLQGNIYGYRLEEKVVGNKIIKCPHCGEIISEEQYEDWQEVDSSWGYYGNCLEDNGMLDDLGLQIID